MSRKKVSRGTPASTRLEDDPRIEVLPAEKPDQPDVVEVDAKDDIIEILPGEGDAHLPEIDSAPEIDGAPEIDSAPEVEDQPDEEESGVVSYDPLSAYLREVSRYPHLTREEEIELGKRYHEHKDLDAAYRLVTGTLWLSVKIARDYERAARSVLDLIQEGNIGLMEAVKNFDPYRGVRFPSYAAWWIKAYILRYVIANWRMVKIGTTQAQRKLFFNLKKEKEKLEREGFFPGPKLLAEKLNVRESDVVEMEQRLGSQDLSVDAPMQNDAGASDYLSVLPGTALSAEDLLSEKQEKRLVSESFQEFASTLNERERVIFEERLLGDEKVTLQDIAEKFSVSKERIRQIENRLRERLKEFLEERLGESAGR